MIEVIPKNTAEKHPWEKTYEQKDFEITTNKASIIVERYKDNFQPGDNVLDIGCGNGRNSIFLSSLGCNVDSFDIANLQWIDKLPQEIKEKINFSQNNVSSFEYKANKYDSIVVTRVIQYLNKEELKKLIDNIHTSLNSSGFILLSFNSQGGIFNQKSIEVPKYKYSIDEIKQLIKQKFKEVVVYDGARQSQSVNYEDEIKSYDIFITNKFN